MVTNIQLQLRDISNLDDQWGELMLVERGLLPAAQVVLFFAGAVD